MSYILCCAVWLFGLLFWFGVVGLRYVGVAFRLLLLFTSLWLGLCLFLGVALALRLHVVTW